LQDEKQMVRSIDSRRGTLRLTQWPSIEVAMLFGTLVAETILASAHVRAHRKAGHMDASDLIKALQNTLRGGGRPHMGQGQSGVPERKRPWQSPPVLAAAPRRMLTPRTATWLVLRRAEKRSVEDQALLICMRRQTPDLEAAVGLAEAFTALVRDRAPDRLDPWLKRAADGAVQQLRRFAKRLSADYDAVRAALTLIWSNGPVEGQINRLKTLKRQMYGRANLDLLERRFLLAA